MRLIAAILLQFVVVPWHFTLPASFDGTEPIFRKLERYGLARNVVADECRKAVPM